MLRSSPVTASMSRSRSGAQTIAAAQKQTNTKKKKKKVTAAEGSTAMCAWRLDLLIQSSNTVPGAISADAADSNAADCTSSWRAPWAP
jgi:hypothetical protein